MTCELVIFDCDGVLIDSEPIANEAFASVLRDHGFAVTGEQLAARFIGTDTRAMLQELAASHGIPIPATLKQDAYAEIAQRYRTELRAIAGVTELLEALALPKCVASSSEPGKLRLGLEVTGLLQHFTPHVYSAHQVARGKPSPDIFLFAASELAASPGKCLVIEDSIAGVEAARAAGMRVIGFTGGSHCQPGHDAILRNAGAEAVIGEIGALTDFF